MKYFLVCLMAGMLSVMVAYHAFADTGVSISLTTTVTGGSSGGGTGIDVGSGGTPLTWEDAFPQLKQQPQSSSPYIPPQQPYVPLPETTHSTVLQGSNAQMPQESESPQPLNGAIVAGIVFGSIAIGLIVWGIYTLINRRRDEYE